MRKFIFYGILVLGLSSCGLFKSQYVVMDPEQVAVLEQNIGKLTAVNLDQWIKAAENLTGSDIDTIKKVGDDIVLKLTPPMQEAGTKAGITLLESVAQNPTHAGILTGLPAAIFAFVSVLTRRASMKEKKNG